MLAEARYFARRMGGCRRFIRTPAAAGPPSQIARNLARREANFLEMLRRAVFDNPANPCHQLFAWAGCTYGDLQSSIAGHGLEATLTHLRRQYRRPPTPGGPSLDLLAHRVRLCTQ